MEEMISDRLACGISDNGPRKKLLQEAELRLEKCMNYCRAAEAADIQLKEISSDGAEAVHHLNGSKMGRAMKECKYCSRKHERGMEKNAQHMARPVQSVPTKTTSVLSA